jgi:3-dehydroquinate synthase
MCNLSVTHPYFKNVLMLWESLLDTTKHRNGNQNLPIPNRLGSCVFINDVTLPEMHDVVGVFEKFTE